MLSVSRQRLTNGIKLLRGDRQGFFHEDMLARLQCPDHQAGMHAMAGQDGNRVDVRVIQNLIVIGSGIRKAKFFGRMLGMQSTRRGDANQFKLLDCLESRQKRGIGKQTRAQDAEFHRCQVGRPCHVTLET